MFAENSANSVHQAHYTNETVRSITGCLPVSGRVKSFRLRFFGHLARSAPEEDHHRVIAAALRPRTDWRRPVGRPRATWLRTIDEDVQPLNFGQACRGWISMDKSRIYPWIYPCVDMRLKPCCGYIHGYYTGTPAN